MIFSENCHILYLLVIHILISARCTISESFKVFTFGCIERRSNTSSFSYKVSLEKALELQLTCETCHIMFFSKSGSFACAIQGTTFDIRISKHFEKFHSFLMCHFSRK